MPDRQPATNQLRLVCPRGHDLGDLTATDGQLTMHERARPSGYMERAYRSVRDTLRAEVRDLEQRHGFAQEIQTIRAAQGFENLAALSTEPLRTARAQLAEWERRGRQPVPALAAHPEGHALAWACMACYRTGYNHATKRLDGPTHCGNIGWSPLANVLAAAQLTETPTVQVFVTKRAATAALRQLVPDEMPGHATRRKRLARSWRRPEPLTPERFREWEMVAFRLPL